MNRLSGKVTNITGRDSLHLVRVRCREQEFTVSVLELPSFVEPGVELDLLFKESEVMLVSDSQSDLSADNRVNGQTVLIWRGDILSQVFLKTACGEISSLITTTCLDRMSLRIGTLVQACVPAYAVALSRKT